VCRCNISREVAIALRPPSAPALSSAQHWPGWFRLPGRGLLSVTGPRGPLVALLVAVVVVSVLTGCGTRAGGTNSAAPPVSTPPTSPTPSALATSPGPATLGPAPGPGEVSMAEAVTAIDARIGVHSGPGGPVTQTFTNPQPSGAPLTFLLKRQDGDWLQVYLPVRPNGSTGWGTQHRRRPSPDPVPPRDLDRSPSAPALPSQPAAAYLPRSRSPLSTRGSGFTAAPAARSPRLSPTLSPPGHH